MDEQIARVIATISTLDSLSTFEANARQRDALTDDWRRRFLEESRNLAVFN